MSTTAFVLGPKNMDLGAGLVTDGNGQVIVATGAAGGVNAGAAVLNCLRAGLIPAAPATAGFNTAVTAATTAIAAISATPTQAQLQDALTAVLHAASALTAA
jgi:hypothetical protein